MGNKISIEKYLNLRIENQGYLSYKELLSICEKLPCKVETATRKLRPSISPNIEEHREKNYIEGWYVKGRRPNFLGEKRYKDIWAWLNEGKVKEKIKPKLTFGITRPKTKILNQEYK